MVTQLRQRHLFRHGEPAPERHRKTTWKEFLCRHREVMVAADFFTIEAWTRRGLTRFLVLFFIDVSSRRVEIAGLARQATGLWMSQVARNLTDAAEGFLVGKRYLIHDRDPLFTAEFLATLAASGVQSVKLPPRSPNLNAHAERFVRTIKGSCLERLILFGEGSLRKAIHEFVEHYHRERNHQGLGNRLIIEAESSTVTGGPIQCRQRLGECLTIIIVRQPRGGASKLRWSDHQEVRRSSSPCLAHTVPGLVAEGLAEP